MGTRSLVRNRACWSTRPTASMTRGTRAASPTTIPRSTTTGRRNTSRGVADQGERTAGVAGPERLERCPRQARRRCRLAHDQQRTERRAAPAGFFPDSGQHQPQVPRRGTEPRAPQPLPLAHSAELASAPSIAEVKLDERQEAQGMAVLDHRPRSEHERTALRVASDNRSRGLPRNAIARRIPPVSRNSSLGTARLLVG